MTTICRPSKRGGKTETLSIRLDEKTRFMLEFAARIKGQSISTVVERAIRGVAEEITTEGQWNGEEGKRWSDYWDDNPGIRVINLARDKATFPTQEEENLIHFIGRHIEFFSKTRDIFNISREYLDALWPSIEHHVKVWHDTRATNPWQAGRDMVRVLKQAGLSAPVWPPKERKVSQSERE